MGAERPSFLALALALLWLCGCRTRAVNEAPVVVARSPPPPSAEPPPGDCPKARAQAAKFDMGPEPSDPPDGSLTLARVNYDLGPDNDNIFSFRTGPDNPDRTCAEMGEVNVLHDGPHETTTAIRVGWLDRRCENNHIQLRLTEAARKLSPRWQRSGDSLCEPRTPEIDTEDYNWFVSAARFERIGQPQIVATKSPDEKRVIVRGRWALTDEGKILKAAGWKWVQSSAAVREERFVRESSGQWHLVRDDSL